MTPVDAVLTRLSGLYPRVIDLSLARVARLLDRLGRPQDRLPPVVHVAGTNGKGSTIAAMRACLEAAGHRVHVYTSPHLVDFRERIRLAGNLIEEAALLELLEAVEQRNEAQPVTVFEVTTAAAFLAFANEPADFLLLETGLGGRLDATNLIERPAVTAITPVSMDHMAYLGDTLAKIAAEKAGILKPGVPGVLGPQAPEALAVIEARAAEIGAHILRHGRDWHASPEADGWRYAGARWHWVLPLPSLPGAHQIDNAGLALACLERIPGLSLDRATVARGLGRIDWPARLQWLRRGPLVDALPPGWELWLDGGHNPAAGAALGLAAAGWQDRPLHLILGMLANRDPVDFVRPLAPFLASVGACTIPDEASHDAAALAGSLSTAGIAAAPAPSIAAALAAATRQPQPAGRILIAGSLYLAGHVLRENG